MNPAASITPTTYSTEASCPGVPVARVGTPSNTFAFAMSSKAAMCSSMPSAVTAVRNAPVSNAGAATAGVATVAPMATTNAPINNRFLSIRTSSRTRAGR